MKNKVMSGEGNIFSFPLRRYSSQVGFLAFLAMTIFCGLCSFADEAPWAGVRCGADGRASLSWNGASEINEWHYVYRSGRRYKSGLAVWTSPALAVVEGRPMAFIGGYDQTMHAMDLLDKKILWRKLTNAEIQSSAAVAKVGGLDTVFWGSCDRSVYAVLAYSGRQLWTRELVPPSNSLGDVNVSSPFVHGDRLYISCFAYDRSLTRNQQKGMLFCLALESGEILWKHEVTNGALSSPLVFTLDKAYLAVAAKRGLLSCFDISGAKPVLAWTFQMPHEVLGSPVFADLDAKGILYLGSKYGNLIAIDAKSGKEVWQRMAGNWIDNSVCVGQLDCRKVVFAGSHDYCVYAFDATSGEQLWKRPLGGEVFSAPAFFEMDGHPYLAAAALDNHLYILDAQDGAIVSSYFTGNPIWDKLAKGETLWGSPSLLSAGRESCVVYGSFNDVVYTLPLKKDCSLTAMARSPSALWWSLGIVFFVFGGIILPLTILLPLKQSHKDIA